jgi:hypothetical protein
VNHPWEGLKEEALWRCQKKKKKKKVEKRYKSTTKKALLRRPTENPDSVKIIQI